MTTTSSVPRYMRVANLMTTNLLRIGLPLNGFGHTPMYLLTVPGRKSGQPRTKPVAVVEQGENRYLFAPFGVVDWVRNLRAAGQASITRARHTEQVRAIEVPLAEAGIAIRLLIESGNPIGSNFGVAKGASAEEFERAAAKHPVFSLQRVEGSIGRGSRR